jgi:hypothetical protein
MNFKEFIKESAEEEKLKHLEHAEDHVINAGHQGFAHAYGKLKDVHDKLTGKDNDTRVTVKYDGSPAVVFGRHPKTGKFFVGSKSIFNKNPKVNYTEEDIERNHGHAPGLVSKLKHALRHLPAVTPEKGVFQGDIMHTKGDVHVSGGKAHFTPNTLTYSAPESSEHGIKARNANIGVAVHTRYHGNDLEDMKAEYAPKLDDFEEHDSVHLIKTDHNLGNVDYKPEHQSEFKKHMLAAHQLHQQTPEEHHDTVGRHIVPLKTYINHTVRTGTEPSVDDFVQHYSNAHQKNINSVKTEKSKAAKQQQMDDAIGHVNSNKKHFQSILDMHKHLQKAKDVLTNTLGAKTDFEHSISGNASKPEGFVVVKKNRPTKFVDRREFSAANFNRDKSL